MQEENREIIREAQERMKEWNVYEFEDQPQTVQIYRQLLESFYEEHGNHPQDTANFNTRVKLSPEAEDELVTLAEAFLEDKGADTDYFEDLILDPKKRDWRERYDIKSTEDAINFLNRVERYRNDRFLREALSSDQIMELYNEGKVKGLNPEDIDKMLYDEYAFSGIVEDDLYNQIWEEIQNV